MRRWASKRLDPDKIRTKVGTVQKAEQKEPEDRESLQKGTRTDHKIRAGAWENRLSDLLWLGLQSCWKKGRCTQHMGSHGRVDQAITRAGAGKSD